MFLFPRNAGPKKQKKICRKTRLVIPSRFGREKGADEIEGGLVELLDLIHNCVIEPKNGRLEVRFSVV